MYTGGHMYYGWTHVTMGGRITTGGHTYKGRDNYLSVHSVMVFELQRSTLTGRFPLTPTRQCSLPWLSQ